MDMGKMYEVSFVVEGYQSDGSFAFTELEVTVDPSTVGINPKSGENSEILIYPNYRPGSVIIKCGEEFHNAGINIYDISGRLVHKLEKINSSITEIDNLKKGMYFLQLNGTGKNYTKKFMVR